MTSAAILKCKLHNKLYYL